jgi:hypothetical protein
LYGRCRLRPGLHSCKTCTRCFPRIRDTHPVPSPAADVLHYFFGLVRHPGQPAWCTYRLEPPDSLLSGPPDVQIVRRSGSYIGVRLLYKTTGRAQASDAGRAGRTANSWSEKSSSGSRGILRPQRPALKPSPQAHASEHEYGTRREYITQ